MKRNLSLMEPSLTFKLRQSAPGDPHGPLRALCWKTYKQTSIANPLLGCSFMPQAIGTTSFVDYFMPQAIGTTSFVDYFMPQAIGTTIFVDYFMPQAIGTTSFVDYFMPQAIGTTIFVDYFMPQAIGTTTFVDYLCPSQSAAESKYHYRIRGENANSLYQLSARKRISL